MGSTFTAHASTELFANPSHSVALSYFTTFGIFGFETHFDFGFKLQSFFPRLGEPVSQPRNQLGEQSIDEQGADRRSMTPGKFSVHIAERGFFEPRFRLRPRGNE